MLKNFALLAFVGFSNLLTAQTDILLVDFQSGIPSNFTMIDNDGHTPAAAVSEYTSAWISKADPADASNLTASSTSYFSPTGTASRWLITNQLNLGTFGNYMSWQAKSHDPSFPDGYLVLVSTTGNQIADFQDTVANIGGEYENWTERTVNLSSHGFNNIPVYLAFVNKTKDGFKLYLDSVHVWIEDPLAINSIENVNLTAYPNPFNETINIKCDFSINRVELIDLNGVIVKSSEFQTQIDTKTIESGVYLLKVYGDAGVTVKKLIKN